MRQPETTSNARTSVPATNGHATNGHSTTNGTTGHHSPSGHHRRAAVVKPVTLPGAALYDDTNIDREEFVRLVIQSLRDVGYIESAATLEAESGYTMEASEVSEFRQCILDGSWDQAELAMQRIGVSDEEGLAEARFLINQQRYLEILEEGDTGAALSVLRGCLAPLNVDSEQLHVLSSLLMCTDAEDVRVRAGWDGASGTSRRRLLSQLQRYIPSALLIPPRRMSTLLTQAQAFQRHRCLYHNSDEGASLYADHMCSPAVFPRVTTMILEGHTNEVWNLHWSHSGRYLATGGLDCRALVWRIGSESNAATRECTLELDLGDHQDPVSLLGWSLDDSILLSASESQIRMYEVRTGRLMRTLDAHTDTVTALSWLPDNTGFISGAMDHKIIIWDSDGNQRDSWGTTAIRVADLAVAPDQSRVVTIGMYFTAVPTPPVEPGVSPVVAPTAPPIVPSANTHKENRLIIYDFATKTIEAEITLEGDLTSIKISADSQYAIVNHFPNEVLLWNLNTAQIERRYTGQKQERHVIRSCFGGIDGNFVASGSEDSNVHIWHRDSTVLLETLPGHGPGSVNAVAWNPRNPRMFASCSDDHTVRIWEAISDVDADAMTHGKGKDRATNGERGLGL